MTLLAILGAVLVTIVVLWGTAWIVYGTWMLKMFTGEWPHPLWLFVYAFGLVLMWGAWWYMVGSNVSISFGGV